MKNDKWTLDMAGIGYRPEIDGLRAVAVIPVILFHCGAVWIPGGFIGVDVFFVISGFLITSIIKNELEQGNFSFRDFWARRVRRILPALLFVTACVLAVTYFCIFRPDQQKIGQQALASLFSVANFFFWLQAGDYWGRTAAESPFLHAWSLSVEEQFYLFLPIAICLIYRFRKGWLQGFILSVVVASLVLFLWGSKSYLDATFYLLPTRAWELGTGCLLAVTLSNQFPKSRNYSVFSMAGLSMIIISYLSVEELNTGLGLAVIGTALVIAFGRDGLCNKILSQRAFIHIGKISYSLYLWHWPVLTFAKQFGINWPGVSDKLALAATTYFLALATYHFVEKPTRRSNRVIPILIAGALVAIVALAMSSIPRSYDASQFNQAKFFCYSPDPNWKLAEGPRWVDITFGNPGYYPDALRDGGIRLGDNSVTPELVIVGDSHAQMWSDAIATVAKENEIPTAFFSQCGEDWWGNEFDRENSLLCKFIEQWKPKVVLVALGWRWKGWNFRREIKAFLEFAGAQGSTVLLVEDPPWFLPCGNRNSIQWLASQGITPTIGEKKYLAFEDENPDEGGRREVRSFAEAYDFTTLVPTYDIFVSPSGVLVLDGKDVIYIDDDHLSSHGAHLAVPQLEKTILNALKNPLSETN